MTCVYSRVVSCTTMRSNPHDIDFFAAITLFSMIPGSRKGESSFDESKCLADEF